MVVQMIGVGEQSGALDAMLAKIADFYEEEVDTAVEALTSAMEPLMIVILGTTVGGGGCVAMYMPIFSMVNALKYAMVCRRLYSRTILKRCSKKRF